MRDVGTVARWAVQVLPSLEKEMLALRHLVRPGDTCIDVGASYGTYTVALARLVGRRGVVHAFEPRSRSRAVLQAAIRMLTPGNVRVHAAALSDRPGTEVLVTPRRRWLLPVPGRTFLKADLAVGGDGHYYDGFHDEFGGAEERHTPTDTLDRVAEREGLQRLTFVKIDVEGAELRVLDGGARSLARFRPAVLCELEDRHTTKYGHGAQDVLERLAADGYRAHIYDGRRVRRVGSVLPHENNYLFLPG